jgi:pimeloyl-ACP methyl ester carboxylesterase
MITTTLDVDGPVRVLDHGGEGALLLLIHGLSGAAENWIAAGPLLAGHGRAVAVDLLGHGDTPPAGRGAHIEANAALLPGVIEALGHTSATLVANSMGGLVSMVAAVESPSSIDRLVLVNPALPLDRRSFPDPEVLVKLLGPLLPVVGPLSLHTYQVLRSPAQAVGDSLGMVAADAAQIPARARQALIDRSTKNRRNGWAVGAFRDADRSVATYVFHPSRTRQLMHRISQPTLLVHGLEDRLVSTRSTRWAAAERPDWAYVELDGIGHVPMLEDPEGFTRVVMDWIDGS